MPNQEPRPARPELPVRAVVVYKLVRGAVEATLALAAEWLGWTGRATALQDLARTLEAHLAPGWSLRVAHAFATATTPHALRLVGLAFGLSSVVTLVEGLALRRGARWASWLVVATTSAFLPFELAEIALRPTAVRVVILLVNVLIVVVLVRHARRRAAPPER